MATKPNKNVKKLSTAMKLGKKIADENGIKQGRGTWLKLDRKEEKLICACAMGMTLIGKYGVEEATKIAQEGTEVEVIEEDFPVSDKVNECIFKTDVVKNRRSVTSLHELGSVVMILNDKAKLPVETIVEALESCRL